VLSTNGKNGRVRKTRNTWTRREVLRGAGSGLALAAAARWGIGAEPTSAEPTQRFLREHGFWEYTTPGTGGFEAYDNDDYLTALDDMARAGMNSLLLVIKWTTTGYRSKLPYLDQSPDNKVIRSDNRLLRKVMAEAKARRIKIWLGAVTSYYDADKFGSIPFKVTPHAYGLPFKVGTYDPDAPHMVERGAVIFEEILDEFPDPDGLMLEMEDVQFTAPHRIPFYNAWAAANNRPPYGDPKVESGLHWFDYQTAAIVKATEAVERAVRTKGFRGDLATINKIGGPAATKNQLVNLEMMRRDCPNWASICYVYEKGLPGGNYDEAMKASITYPKSLGMNVYYLPRGVMTWGGWTDRQRLEQSWAQDVADVLKFQPQNVWWFGAGSKKDGCHTALSVLKQLGYADDVAARRALLKIAAPLRAARKRAQNGLS
jgi:hypothetical protein